jgi:predicted phage baseplate assembly protein
MQWDAGSSVPSVFLTATLGLAQTRWSAERDLLGSGPQDTHFVVETEADGRASLRFGDGEHGDDPAAGTEFAATYRVGNGRAGNIGADALTHVVSVDTGILSVRNPLPARGGVEPESIEHVRQSAPYAFRTQERAVTRDDYAEVTERRPDVQKAAAAFRWTGSWHTVFVSADRLGGRDVDALFRQDLENWLDLYRMAGQDVGVDTPVHVPLEVELEVCVCPGYARSDVQGALSDLFSSRVLPDGRRGRFHPDNFTFGQTVYLSPLIAAAQNTPGVCGVTATVFQRDSDPASSRLEAGFLPMGRLEIPELASDPSFPERGTFTLRMEGGL